MGERKLMTAEEVFRSTADEQTALAEQYEKSPDTVAQWGAVADRLATLFQYVGGRAVEFERDPETQGEALMLGGMIKAAAEWSGGREAHIHLLLDMLERLHQLEITTTERRAIHREAVARGVHRAEIQSKDADIEAQKRVLERGLLPSLPTIKAKPRPKRITQERAAEIITRVYEANGLKGITGRQLRRWESEKDPTCPEWYNRGLRDLGEDAFTDNVRRAATAEATKRQLRNTLSYRESDAATSDDPSARIDEKERAELIRQLETIPTEELATMLENYQKQEPERHPRRK